MPIRRPRGPSPQQVRRRRIVALAAIVLAVGAAIAAVVVALPHVKTTKALPPPPPAPKPFRVIFPEGFTRAQMIERVGAVAKIAARKKRHAVALNSRTYALATRRAKIPCFTPPQRPNLEGFLFPATYDFLATTTSRAARGRPARDLLQELEPGEPRVREEQEPDAVRRPDHRFDGREGDTRAGRAPEGRRRHLQPPARAHASRHRRHAAVRAAHPADEVDPAVAARQRQSVQLATPDRLAADPDREPRPRLDPGGGASGQGRLPLLRAQAGQSASLLHGERHRVRAVRVRSRLWL